MPEPDLPQRLLVVNTSDEGGGAATIARSVHEYWNRTGRVAWLCVGDLVHACETCVQIDNDAQRSRWARLWNRAGRAVWGTMHRAFPSLRGHDAARYLLGQPGRYLRILRGYEDFEFPATERILDIPPERPDLLHLHNLHGGFFDIRKVPQLSERVPTVLTLHDEWAMTGHCAYALDCDRWRDQCGACPRLGVYPAVRADKTRENARIKRQALAESSVLMTAPSRWLAERASQVLRTRLARPVKLVYNGIEEDWFEDAPPAHARAHEHEVRVIVVAGHIESHNYKNYPLVQRAFERIETSRDKKPLSCAFMGSTMPPGQLGCVQTRSTGYLHGIPEKRAAYRGADLLVLPSAAESFGLVALEAMACGLPVVATAVGGVPELVVGLDCAEGVRAATPSGAEPTGILVPPDDADALARAIERLRDDPALRRRLGEAGRARAWNRFRLVHMMRGFEEAYAEAAEAFRARHSDLE